MSGNNRTANLLASLTGEPSDLPLPRPSSPEQDLFGAIDDDIRGQVINLQDQNPLSVSVATMIPTASPAKLPSSLLASSGLMTSVTVTAGEGGGGLFDELDREEERQRQEEERQREEARIQEAELKRVEEERLRLQAEQQAQQQAQQQAFLEEQAAAMQRQQMMQQQQHQYQQQQQQQQMMQQQQQMYGMQSVQLQSNNPLFSPPPTQPYGHSSLPVLTPDNGFYRDHPALPAVSVAPSVATNSNTYVYTQTGGAVQTHVVSRLPPAPTPNITAGMGFVKLQPVSRPPPVEPIYAKVTVSDPLLIQPYSFLGMQPPHWTYQVQTNLKEGGCWLVRRRFRHVVTLEEKLREECKGSILPPRPDKYVARALEEASTLQTAEFAVHRCVELEVYLNQLARHPVVGKSSCLRLFLALQDDMGTAWPEVSSNALTRLGAVSLDTTPHKLPWDNPQDMMEDNAELLALASSEGLRMGAVTQAVPKLEGALVLLREYGEAAGLVGMELGKLSKQVEAASDRDLGLPIELLSGGLLRSSRRQKRLATELAASMNSFVMQYKLCRYEKFAFTDRRAALLKRAKDRGKADMRAQQLMIQQRSQVYNSHLERDATVSDDLAIDAVKQCEDIGAILKSEVNRISFDRRTEWSKSMKVICSAMKEAATEQVSVWEATREAFLQHFPQDKVRVGPGK